MKNPRRILSGVVVGCGGQMVGRWLVVPGYAGICRDMAGYAGICRDMAGYGGQMVGCGGHVVGMKKPRCCRGLVGGLANQPPACAASRPYVEKSTVLSLQYL